MRFLKYTWIGVLLLWELGGGGGIHTPVLVDQLPDPPQATRWRLGSKHLGRPIG
jgi:hypothetical protein